LEKWNFNLKYLQLLKGLQEEVGMGIVQEHKCQRMFDSTLKDVRLRLSEREAKEWKSGIFVIQLSLPAQCHWVAVREYYDAAEQHVRCHVT
jgi:hypothetical protein